MWGHADTPPSTTAARLQTQRIWFYANRGVFDMPYIDILLNDTEVHQGYDAPPF